MVVVVVVVVVVARHALPGSTPVSRERHGSLPHTVAANLVGADWGKIAKPSTLTPEIVEKFPAITRAVSSPSTAQAPMKRSKLGRHLMSSTPVSRSYRAAREDPSPFDPSWNPENTWLPTSCAPCTSPTTT